MGCGVVQLKWGLQIYFAHHCCFSCHLCSICHSFPSLISLSAIYLRVGMLESDSRVAHVALARLLCGAVGELFHGARQQQQQQRHVHQQ